MPLSLLACFALGCSFLILVFFVFGPEALARASNEDVFKRWFRYRDDVDVSGQSFYYFGDEAMTAFAFESNFAVEHGSFAFVALLNALREGLRVAGLEQYDVAADLVLEFGRSSDSDKPSLAQDGEPIAPFSFFHQMRGNDDGD